MNQVLRVNFAEPPWCVILENNYSVSTSLLSMQELKSILDEFVVGWNQLPNYSKRIASIVGAQTVLCVLSLLYCIVGMYH